MVVEQSCMADRTRRALLRTAAVASVGFAGCLTDESGTPTNSTDVETGPPPETTASTPPTETSTNTPTKGTPGDGTPSGAAVVWRNDLDAPVSAGAAVARGVAVLGTDAGTIVGLDPADGSIVWERSADAGVRALAAGEETVYAITGSYALGSGHVLHAFDPISGEERWTTDTDWWLEFLGVDDGTLFVHTSDDIAGGGNPETLSAYTAVGERLWSAEIPGQQGGVVTNQAVYAAGGGQIAAFDRSGSRQWTSDVGEYAYNTLVRAGDTVGFVTESEGGRSITALEAATGTNRWSFEDWFVTSLTALDGMLFGGGEQIARFDPTSGEITWKAGRGGYLYHAPSTNGAILAGGDAIVAYATGDGTEGWSFASDAASEFLKPTAVSAGTVLVQGSKSRDDRNRHLFGVDAADGSERWRFVADAETTEPVHAGDVAVVGSENGTVFGLGG